MSELIRRRLEEVVSLIPCPVSGCWFVSFMGLRLPITMTRTANATFWKSGPGVLTNQTTMIETVTRRRKVTSCSS